MLQAKNGIWTFSYARTWLEHPRRFPLSPFLPLSEEILRDEAVHRPAQCLLE
ncbi:MAG: HipA N-terminal domain-containing protein [Pseudomonadota bacterium]